MSGWYALTPAGTVALGNLTPVGQNSGQVGYRWPPNGHQLAACLDIPTQNIQLWGPFWHWNADPDEIYVMLPQTVYYLQGNLENNLPKEIFRCRWERQWRIHPDHEGDKIQLCGSQYLIAGSSLKVFWRQGKLNQPKLVNFPWHTLTLSHNSRQQYVVKDEGGFFAEMTTLMAVGWSILVKILGNYTPPASSCLGAGATPVVITPVEVNEEWLTTPCEKPNGAVLLTGGLWQQGTEQVSLPYPPTPICAYAATEGIPWQSWKKVDSRQQPGQKVSVLTPGEWLTPAGAVYLWEGISPLVESRPYRDPFHRDALGYGHLWLFSE